MTLTREAHGEFRMPNPKYAAYKASRPYFELVRGALGDLVDGEHFLERIDPARSLKDRTVVRYVTLTDKNARDAA